MIPGVRYTLDPLRDHVTPLHTFSSLFPFLFYLFLFYICFPGPWNPVLDESVIMNSRIWALAVRCMHVWRFVY